MNIQDLTVEAIVDGVEKTLGELAVMNHQLGHYHIAIKVEGGQVVDYWLCETVDGYFRADGWVEVARIGTGNIDCNCDACAAAEDPEDCARTCSRSI